MSRTRTAWTAAAASGAVVAALLSMPTGGAVAGPSGSAAAQTAATRPPTSKNAVAVGRGGAVASVDADATRVGLRVLRRGGTAADAAVATAAALGVTEPYSAGLGGGGFFVYYEAKTDRVSTIDGREKAPASMRRDAFIDPETDKPYNFSPELVTSGVSVGVPGTPQLWARATRRWGVNTLGQNLRPAARLARRGFVVDRTFHRQTRENNERFRAIRPTRRLFLDNGKAPKVGSLFRNPELARTYEFLARNGMAAFYHGRLAGQIVSSVQNPRKTATTDLPVPPGSMTRRDLDRYTAPLRRPTRVGYRGVDVFGMAPPSSGGSTVGEALNILDNYDLGSLTRVEALHLYLEASATAFADRNAYVGDSDFVDVPLRQLLSQGFADKRACTINPAQAATKPVPAGKPDGRYQPCPAGAPGTGSRPDTEGLSTTHVVVADRWGNVASYTLTNEQTGGSAITVPGRGFLLNNELTDFTAVYDRKDPNRIHGGKRPRSSMSPTLVFRGGRPIMAIGSPGGSTIITTVLQTLINRLDFGMALPRAVNAPRASQRNTETVSAEQAFLDRYQTQLEAYGHEFTVAGEPGTSAAEIGAVEALLLRPGGQMLAAAEKTRRGGGDAGVVRHR